MSANAFNRLSQNPLFQQTSVYQTFLANPLGFIDVGARGGAHSLVEPIAAITAVLGFEPDLPEYERMLNDASLAASWAKFTLEPLALADCEGDAQLHLLSAATNHSLRRPNGGFTSRYNMVKWQEVGTWDLKTTRLDDVLFGKRQTETYWGEMIKLDTQGTEFEILQGSLQTLSERTVAIVTEVAFCELYQGQKLFSEIEMLLREKQFSFYGFHTTHTRSLKQLDKTKQVGIERAMYADAVFFKDPLPGSFCGAALPTRSLHVLFTAALLLEYYDFALELATKTFATNQPEEIAVIKQLIYDLAHYAPDQTVTEVIKLMEAINKNPAHANLYAGKFVDRKRLYFDYDDVLKVE
ncbi:MAG: FkbM family methyltransferase [Gammaproteobacteria bacterium]|nr:FkbM family methyltransferase [Gammaproteobacteria bacterium]